MKKLLLSSAAIGLALSASPASAQVELELGGYFQGYGMYTNQDDDSVVNTDSRELDIIRNTEIHMGGETTLDNGLTVGMWLEMLADNTDSFDVQESYAYFSGGWGRVNFGSENGAAYLLQVAAPSADTNLDGIRQFITPINYTSAAPAAANLAGTVVDYDDDVTAYADKLTYLSPIMNGFQVGVSYTPDVDDTTTDIAGNTDGVNDALGEAYEGSVRYEGQFDNVGVTLGAGYTVVDLEADSNTTGNEDDQTSWNVGADFEIGPFGVGVIYKEDNFAENMTAATPTNPEEEETFVVGVDYTTGAFKFGASYLDQDNTGNVRGNDATNGVETTRYAGGVVYTYGPGMTFRGSLSYLEHENVAGLANGTTIDATTLLLGTQINF